MSDATAGAIPTRWQQRAVTAFLALAIGVLATLVCYGMRQQINPGAGDFHWALTTTRELLAGRDPYGWFTPSVLNVPYPLPVVIFGLPLVWLPDQALAAALFFGASSALLAWGIVRSGERWRLLVFTTSAYVQATMFAQWSPLVMAAWYFPILAPLLVTVKPQIALPVALNRLTVRGVGVAITVLLASLVLLPTWPLRWLSLIGDYNSLIPALTLPFGPLLLFSVLGWRSPYGRLLLFMSILPFRVVYDLLALWLIPRSPPQMLVLVVLSWLPPLLRIGSANYQWTVPFLFLPALAIVLWQERVRVQARVSTLASALFARRVAHR